MALPRVVVLLVAIVAATTACSRADGPKPPAPAATTPSAAAPAGETAPGGGFAPDARTFTGTVGETMNAGGYTYARLDTGGTDVWIAANELPLATGDTISVAVDMSMENFHSKTLDRDFPTLYFVSRVAKNGEPLAAAPSGLPSMAGSHGEAGAASSASASPAPAVTVTAPPAGGHAIAEVWARKDQLAGTPVTVRGTVVKVNNGILDRNWLHLQDGSGEAKDGTNDLTVTTSETVKVGDVVTLRGTLGTKKDFGAGYAYDAILEQATVAR